MGLPARSSSRTSGMGERGIEPQFLIVAFSYRPDTLTDQELPRPAYLRPAKRHSININTDRSERAGGYWDVGFPAGRGPADQQTMISPSTVLMIDDAPALHEVLRTCFAKEPLALHFATDAAGGLALARRLEPDLILLDVAIPGEDGFELCRKLKADPATRDIQVIFLTAASMTTDKQRGLEMGAIDYITKPFDLVELKARVRSALRTKHLLD